MFFGTANKEKKGIREMILSIDQHAAWEDMLGIQIKRFTSKSDPFVNPLRSYNSTSPTSALMTGKDGIMRLYDLGHPSYHCISLVDLYSRTKIVSPFDAAKELSKGFNDIFIPKSTPHLHEESKFVFKVSFDYRQWREKDEEFFLPQGLSIADLEKEQWRPVSKMAFNSRSNPNGWFVNKPKLGYAIPVKTPFGTKHKMYCPGNTIKFLSTAPTGSVGGFSSVNKLKPIVVCKSAKDHALLSKVGVNTRWIVNGEGNMPSEEFIGWCATNFPKGYFFYDNDQGIEYAQRAAGHANRFLDVNFFTPVWIPVGMPKDPTDYFKHFGNIAEVKKLLK